MCCRVFNGHVSLFVSIAMIFAFDLICSDI